MIDTSLPEHVFAVPTCMVNGRVTSLGNPIRERLHQKLKIAQQSD